MRYIKKARLEKVEVNSIKWNNRKGIYTHETQGEHIGTIVTHSIDQVIQLDDSFVPIGLCEDNNASVSFHDTIARSLEGAEYQLHVHSSRSQNDLPFGVFKMGTSMSRGLYLEPYVVPNDKVTLIENKKLVEKVQEFYSKPTVGRKNKKGILLYGPPGNGKTTEIMQLFPLAQELGMRIFIVDKSVELSGLGGMQKLLQQDKTLFILEELTERLSQGAEDLLTFLDGENSWNNTVVIATTNHPEVLPANLVDRPGRFDAFIEYTNPTKKDIFALAARFNVEENDAINLAGEGLSFDYVSFIIAEAAKTGKTVNNVRKDEADKRKRLSDTFRGKIGIGTAGIGNSNIDDPFGDDD